MATATKPLPELGPDKHRYLPGGLLSLPSESVPGVWRTTDSGGGCSCPRGDRHCWHKRYRAKVRNAAIKALRDAGSSPDEIVLILGERFPEIRDYE